jgi:methyl-accepting chemotaxis protein
MMLTSLFSTREQVLGQALYDAIPMMEFDIKGTIVSANTDFLTLLGHRLNELSGKPYTVICDLATVADGRAEDIWRRVSGGETLQETLKLQARDGSARWMQACLLPVRASMGKMERVILAGCDITAIKQKELASRNLLKALSDTHAVVEFCARGQILYANDSFLKLTGYSLNELLGRPHRKLCEYDRGLSSEYSDFWDGLAKGQARHGECVRYGKDGRHIALSASYNPVLDDAGAVAKVVLYATPIARSDMDSLRDAA